MSNSEARKASILTAAAEMFAARGYSGSGVDEIGEAVGVSGPALYRHFANKQAILDEICVVSVRALLNEAKQIIEEGLPPKKTLERLVEMRVEFAYGSHRHAFEIYRAGDTALSDKAFRQQKTMEDLYRAEWMRILTQIRPTTSTIELHVSWLAAHHLIGYTAASEYSRDEEEHKRHLEKMAMAVLLA
jgi:AcrR family transcriptional regulator